MTKGTYKQFDAIIRNDFSSFGEMGFHSIAPSTPFQENWHIDVLCQHAQSIIDRKCRRLVVNAPPRSLKSLVLSVLVPAFVLGRDPTSKIIYASYSDAIAGKLASDFRLLINSHWYHRIFGKLQLVKDTEAETATTSGGYRLTTSVGGSLTGRGGDIIIIDDPLNASEAASKASRDRVNDWFRSTVLTRLDNPTTGTIVIVMQRLHVENLSGVVLGQGGWDHLSLPAIAPEDRVVNLGAGRTFTWRRGEPLHPTRLPHTELDRQKAALGTAAFSAQYLQTPVPAEGTMLKSAWLRYVEAIPPRWPGDQVVQSWDTALKAKDSNDYSVGLTFLVRGRNEVYLIDVVRARKEFPELKKSVIREASLHAATAVLIEEHGSGISLIQEVRSAVLGIKGISHQSDKQTRMYGATPLLEGGILHLPKNAPWLDDFLAEYLAFPNGKHDDQMDALSQFLNWHGEKQRSCFEADWGFVDAPRAPSADSFLGMLRR